MLFPYFTVNIFRTPYKDGIRSDSEHRENSAKLLKEKSMTGRRSFQASDSNSNSEPCIPLSLKNELLDFCTFCSKNSFKMNIIENPIEFDEIYFIEALQFARRGINIQNKKIIHLEKIVANSNLNLSENDMMTRINNLQIELLLAQKSKNDVKALKMKLMIMVEKIRNEKDLRMRTDDEIFLLKKKNSILNEHTDKLVNYLKREAITKLKTIDTLRRSEKSNKKILENVLLMTKKSSVKDRLILELKESKEHYHFFHEVHVGFLNFCV